MTVDPQNLMHAPIGFFISTPAGRYVSVNPAQATMLGYETPEEFIASITDIATQVYVDPLEREKFMTMLEAQEEVLNFECRFRQKNGSVIWGSVNTSVVRGANGEISHYRGFTTDITARKNAEEELRRSEQKYRELIDNINDVIFTVDLDGRITYLSPSAQHIFPEALALSGRNFMDIVDPRDLELVRRAWNDLLQNRLQANEYRLCLEPQKTIWVRTSSRPAYRDGVLVGVVGVLADITERKLTEEYLNEVLDATNDGIWDYDLVTGKFGCSNRWAQMLGYEPGEVDDFSCYCQQNIHPDDKARFTKAFMDYVEGRSASYEIEFRLRKKCGEYIWIYSRGKALQRDPAGRALRMVGAHTDIHAQKKIEESLRESEERFRTLIESAPVSVLLVQNGRYVYGNPASARLLGHESPEALVGMNALETIAPEYLDHVRKRMQRIEFGADNVPMEMQILRHDGGRVWCISTSVRTLMNNVPTAIVVGQDITRQKHVEERLIRAKEEADAANRAKSEFLANMSHELRTPLNGIMGMMQLLQTTRLDGEQGDFVALAIKSSERLTRLLTDLLDISKIEAGKMDVVDEEFSPRELADSVSELFTVNATARDVALECIIDPAMPSRLVGGIARLRQILFNLVGNSLKFTDSGVVRVEMTPLAASQGNQLRVLFSVSDTGIGIPDDKFRELFKPFVQVEGAYTRKYQGAGLGLAIVRRLVELMHGHIYLESALGEGTAVHVVLPFRLPHGVAATAAPEKTKAGKAAPGLRVLLAEDDPSNQFPVQRMLEKIGHVVTVVENGRQAVELLRDHDFDCILMDIQMPLMDGIEATRVIRTAASTVAKRTIPIIALTAYAMSGDRERFLQFGMDDYLSKPLSMLDLERMLRKYSSAKL
jgi:PAS domain S-box-containing protein